MVTEMEMRMVFQWAEGMSLSCCGCAYFLSRWLELSYSLENNFIPVISGT